MPCSHIGPNGQPSILAQQLLDKYQDPALRDGVMTYIHSNEFAVEYGELNDGTIPLDETGEPAFDWVVENVIGKDFKPVTKTYEKQAIIVLKEPSVKVKKSERVSKDTILAEIRKQIIDTAKANPNTLFTIGYTDLASKYANDSGYTTREYANLMDEIRDEFPTNVQFSEQFTGAMNNSPNRIQMNLERLIGDQVTRVPVNMDGKVIQSQLERMTIPVIDGEGRTVGLFDEVEQDTAFQTVMGITYNYALKVDPSTPVNKILEQTLYKLQQAEQALSKSNPELSARYGNIVKAFAFTDSRPSFTSMVLDNFKALGYKVDDATRNKLLNALTKSKYIYAAPISDLQINIEDVNNFSSSIDMNAVEEQFENSYDSSLDKDSSRGRGTQDWSEVSFEIDQRDTASTRMKMFISTIEESDYGKYSITTDALTGIDFSHIQDVNKLTLTNAIKANGKPVYHTNPEMTKAILEKLTTEFEIIPFRNSLAVNQLVDFDDVFENALSALAGQSNQTIEQYTKILQESRNPNLKTLANKLNGRVPGKPNTETDIQLQNEFVKVFSKQYNPFLMILTKLKTDSNGNTYNEIRLMDAQRGSQVQTIVKEWQEYNKLSDMMIVKEDGSRVLDTNRALNKHLPLVQAYNIVFNKLKSLDTKSANYTAKIEELKGLLSKFKYTGSPESFILDANGDRTFMKTQFKGVFSKYGIELNDDMVNGLFGRVRGNLIKNANGTTEYNYIDAMEKMTKGTKKPGDLASQFSITDAGLPNGLFSTFFMKAAGITSDKDIQEGDIEDGEEQATLNNPLYTEGTTMRILAGINAKFTPVIHSSTHKSIEGKKIWDYSHNTALSKRIQFIKSNFDEAIEQYNATDLMSKDGTLSEGSFYLRKWKEKPDLFNKFQLYYLEGLRFGNREKGTTRSKMSDREQLLSSILAFQNGGQLSGHFMSLTHSDKTMTPVFYNVPKMDVGIKVVNKIVVDEFKELFHAEYRRIATQFNEEFNDAKYNTGKKHFFFLPQFNRENLQSRIGEVLYGTNIRLTEDMVKSLWKSDGTIADNTDAFKPVLESMIQEHIKNLTQNSMDTWAKNGITTSVLDKRVIAKYEDVLGKLSINATEEQKQEREDILVNLAARDYALNHFLWNANMSMLFYGDPAQTWKGSVEGTMKEYAKRLAKDIAPGQDLAFKEGATYTTITLADVEPTEEFITKLGITNNSNGTDAQEFTTVQEHLNVMYAAGLISTAKHTELSSIIKQANGEYYEFTPEQLNIILQPMKPVYAGLRAPINGAMLYDYVKSSAYPLLPQFTKGLEIDKIRNLMENNKDAQGNPSPIDRANFISAKKIGAPTVSAKLLTKDGKFDDSVQYQSSIQTLDRSGFRIQQDVPYDEDKEAIKIVSQMNKLIMEGLGAVDTTFTLADGRTFNSQELRQFKEQIRKDMLAKNLNEFMEKLGSTKDGNEWTKPDKIKIAQLLKSEAESRGYSKNEVDVLSYLTDKGTFEVPVFLHPSVEKFESLLMSMMKKVAETKMPGKSYVQASSVGYTRSNIKTLDSADQTNIVWVGDYDGSKPLRHQQLIENPDGTKTVIPAQVIMPFNFFTEVNGEQVKQKLSDYLVPGTNKLDMEKVPKELLQLIGARIPNQGHNSMMAMEIVGFTPESMGDIIFVPSAITGQMGSDFDVDKLYTYKRPYTSNSISFTQDKAPNTKASLQTDYFDVHWGVLTNPEMYAKVLNPLDKPDLKEMNKKFTEKKSGFYNYYDVISQLSDFQSGKDAKALVGLTSLSVTFNSVIQDKNIRLGSYVKGESGGMIELPTSVNITYNGKQLKLTSMSGNGTGMYNGSLRTKHDNLTTIQSGAVDNAKDRTLDNLNITVATYPVLAALHQLETEDGEIVNMDFSTALTTQEVMWEFSRLMRQGNDSLSTEYNKDLKNSVIVQLRAKYTEQYNQAKGISENVEERDLQGIELTKAVQKHELSPESLQKSWNKWQNGNGNTAEYAVEQLAALKLFEELSTYGDRLGVLQKTFNQDTNGAGPSIVYAIQQQSNYENTFKKNQSKVFLNESSISNEGQSEQGYIFENIIPMALKVAEEMFPIGAMYNGIETVMAQTGKQLTDMTLDNQRNIIRAIRSYTLTGTDTFSINPDAERSRLLNGIKSQSSLAQRVEAFKGKLKDNYFLQRLQTNINILGKGPDMISYQNAKTVRLDDEKNVSAFMSMLNSQDNDVRLLAEDLIRYTYLLNPQNGPTSFIKHIPTSYLVATKFAEDMRNAMDKLYDQTQSEVFQGQLFQHNPTQTIQIQEDMFGDHKTEGQDYPEWFMLDDSKASVLEIDKEEGKAFADYIHYRNKVDGKVVLYRLKSNGDSLIYQRIDTLGKGDKTEYNAMTSSTVRSMFTENRALTEWTPTITVAQALTNQVDKMIAASQNTENQVANWGLPIDRVGKMTDVNNALINLSTDRTVPEYLKTVAKVMSNSSQTLNEYDALTSLGIGLRPFTVTVDPNLKELGTYSFGLGTLKLRPDTNKVRAAETFLHEMAHQRTSAIAAAMGFVNSEKLDEMDDSARTQYDKMVQAYRLKYPELYTKLTRLDRIRFEALQEFRKRMGADGVNVEQMEQDVREGKLRSSNHQLLYGLHNLQEFIAHTYTNKEVMQFLNTVKSKESKTVIQQVWDLLTDILSKLDEFIGTKVNNQSLLKEAFELTLHLNNLTASEYLGITINDGQVVSTTLRVQTEAKANQLQEMVETTYQQEVISQNTLTEHLLQVTDKKLSTSSDVQQSETMQKVLDKMRNQVAELNNVLSTRKVTKEDTERHIVATRYKREIEKDIQEMIQHKNLLELGNLGNKQLGWVSTILAKPTPNVHETILAMNLLDMWYNLDKTIYDGSLTDVNAQFAEMVDKTQGQASRLRGSLLNFGTNALRLLGNQKGVQLSMEDFGIKLKNMDTGSAQFITLSRNGNDAIQLVTSITQEAANNTDEEMVRLRNRLNKIEKLIKTIPGKKEDVWNKFIQQSEDGQTWGLVQALNATWYKGLAKSKYSLKGSVIETNKKLKSGTGDYIAAKKKSFEKFWQDINKEATVVNITRLLDIKTGEKHPETYQKEYDRLVEVCGNKEVVDAAIDRAIENYQHYMEDKLQYFSEIEDLQLTEEEIVDIQLSSEQLGTLSEADQKQELAKMQKESLNAKIVGYQRSWVSKNSPASFIDTQDRNAAPSKFNNELHYFPEFVPKKGTKMFDEAYNEIQKNDTLKQVYDEFKDMSETFRSYLPPGTQDRLHDNFLPVVTNEDMATFLQQLGKLNATVVGQKVLNAFSASQYDKDRVTEDGIPLNFIHRGTTDLNDLSRNLPKIFEMFGNMATHYKNMRPVQEVIDTMQLLLHEAAKTKDTETSGRENLDNLSKAIQYYKENLIFKKPKKLEMVSDTPVYSINPMKNKRIERRVVEIKKEIDDLDNQLFEQTANGEQLSEELQTKKKDLENELKTIEKNARYLTGSKAADVLIGINQLKALSYNPFSAINNLTFGVMAAFIHAYGKVDYNPSDLRWGFRKMKASVGKSLTFNQTSSGDATKIRNIMDRIGVISEIMDTMYGKSNLHSSEQSNLRKTIDPYAWQKSGDYLHKGAMVLAMMKKEQVTVTENEIEKTIPLYEALNTDGEWNIEKYGENEQWSSEDVSQQTAWNKFRDKSRKVAIIVHGNQDKNAPIMAKSKMLGRLVGQFRMSWLSEGVNTRFGKGYTDQQLGREVKGRWRTYGELGVVNSIKTLLAQTASILTKSDPFAGVQTRKGTELTEVDKENMRKNIAGLAYTIAFLIATQSLKAMGPSEEEKKRRRRKGQKDGSINYRMMTLNMLNRSYQDLMLYSSPSVFDQVTGNLVPALNVINDAGKAIGAVVHLPFNNKKNAGKKAAMKVFKALPFTNLIPKIDYMMNRDISSAAR